MSPMLLTRRQVAVSLAGGEIIYFELDAAGMLMEMGTVARDDTLPRASDLARCAGDSPSR